MNKIKTICYVIPYFGKLPANFNFWLLSCSKNPTINWLIFTDDKTKYDYPSNVKVIYCSFEEIKSKIQKRYNFNILIDRPWKLCDFKVAYGDIFKEELKGYDFWGHCDIDLVWGDIRKFITDDILEKYDKIGFQGHSTIYKNNDEVNSRYRIEFNELPSYKEIFSSAKGFCFDENIICEIYDRLNISYYKETNFAHLSKYDYGFFIKYLPKVDDYKNDRQVFVWKDGKIIRKYLWNNKIYDEEFMYLHFFCRPMKYKIDKISENNTYVMYPDIVEELKLDISCKFINKKGKKSKIKYYIDSMWYNRKKITIKKIYQNIKRMVNYKKQK